MLNNSETLISPCSSISLAKDTNDTSAVSLIGSGFYFEIVHSGRGGSREGGGSHSGSSAIMDDSVSQENVTFMLHNM